MQPFFIFFIKTNMIILYKESKIYYEVSGSGEAILFLCGWGYGSELIKPLASGVAGKKIFLDFPMFGKSEGLKCDWALQDYADLVLKVLETENLKQVKIVGHSFGGKVAILLAGKYNVCKQLVLVCSAGIKPKKSFIRWCKIKHYKRSKKMGKNLDGFGSADFKALPQDAKNTFVKIVNTHVDLCLKHICVPTLVIAGKYDKETPLYMQKAIAKNIIGAQLVVQNGGHFVWINNFVSTQQLLVQFLGKKEE